MHTYMHVCMHVCSKLHTSVHPSMHTYVHAFMPAYAHLYRGTRIAPGPALPARIPVVPFVKADGHMWHTLFWRIS